MWVFYSIELVGGILVGGDWIYISLIAVIFIPISFLFKYIQESSQTNGRTSDNLSCTNSEEKK